MKLYINSFNLLWKKLLFNNKTEDLKINEKDSSTIEDMLKAIRYKSSRLLLLL